jgi:hypothetical protein
LTLFFSKLKAFRFERIIFGSAPSPVSRAQSNAGDWYEIAREAFAELGVDQESVDAVFGDNAQRIYAAGSNGRVKGSFVCLGKICCVLPLWDSTLLNGTPLFDFIGKIIQIAVMSSHTLFPTGP